MRASLLGVVAGVWSALGVAAAGPLSPPAGAVQSTGKTLAQVEPRTPIGALPAVIDRPGSYYLTGDLEGTVGIRISVPGVTLDLGGFTLRGARGGTSTPGVRVDPGVTQTTILNGTIENWSFDGVNAPLADHGLIQQVTATANAGDGFDLGAGWVVNASTATDNGGSGIGGSNNGIASDVVAIDNAGDGITLGAGSSVAGASASGNAGAGVSVGAVSSVSGSTARQNAQVGFRLEAGATVVNAAARGSPIGFDTKGPVQIQQSTAHFNGIGFMLDEGSSLTASLASSNDTVGIRASINCSVVGNSATGNALGIETLGAGNRIDGNTATSNGIGIRMIAPGSLAIRNVAGANQQNFQFEPGSAWGTILNVGGDGQFGVADTFANLGY